MRSPGSRWLSHVRSFDQKTYSRRTLTFERDDRCLGPKRRIDKRSSQTRTRLCSGSWEGSHLQTSFLEHCRMIEDEQ